MWAANASSLRFRIKWINCIDRFWVGKRQRSIRGWWGARTMAIIRFNCANHWNCADRVWQAITHTLTSRGQKFRFQLMHPLWMDRTTYHWPYRWTPTKTRWESTHSQNVHWKIVWFWSSRRWRPRRHSRDSPHHDSPSLRFYRLIDSQNRRNCCHHCDHSWLPFYRDKHIHTVSVWCIFRFDGDALASISLHFDQMSLIHSYLRN